MSNTLETALNQIVKDAANLSPESRLALITAYQSVRYIHELELLRNYFMRWTPRSFRWIGFNPVLNARPLGSESNRFAAASNSAPRKPSKKGDYSWTHAP